MSRLPDISRENNALIEKVKAMNRQQLPIVQL